ncbi:c-type cytochrome [Ideonella sp. BN130291]|uniref:c-type cytochrome n=1 Tax=Ideonella sp. BN130291 TaxID=3112940 RepID=UPI002E2586D1|nr:c-type cytochrome [Ideonella sp. BN130291]
MKKALTLSTLLASLAAAAFFGAPAAQAQTAASAPATAAAASGPSPAASPRAADKLVAMCIGCHNIPGYQASFPEVHKVPMIAGQSAKYIVSALNAYKKGDRKHPTMRGIAQSLSDQDMNDIASYYEQLAAKAGEPAKLPDTLQVPADVQALLTKGACVSCHGANLNKPLDPSYPKLAGQYSDYLYVALKAYQVEKNPHVGRSNPIMAAQAKQFSHAELKTLANYIGSLPSELKTVPQSRFR